MTLEQVVAASQPQRLERMRKVFALWAEADEERKSVLVDEALLLLAETLRFAKGTPPPDLPATVVEYMEALLEGGSPSSLVEAMGRKMVDWVAWTEEYKSADVSEVRREQLRALLVRVGLIRKKR